jgi:glycosyltransferase involved in cell wall biosynthesis
MPIYIDIASAVHSRAGLGRYAESLARALVREAPGQFAFFYNATRPARPMPGLDGLAWRSVPLGYKPWRMAVWLGQMAHLGYDRLLPDARLYHATEHLLMPLRDTPTVLTVHDLIFELFPQHHKRLNYWFLKNAMPVFVRRADAIIAISESTRRDLMQNYGTPADKITVVYEGASPAFQPAGPAAISGVRRAYDLPERFLLCVGTIEPRKNLPRLLQALTRLRQGEPDLHLVVVGKRGWLYEEFFRQIEQLGLEKAVHLPGYVPDADLPAVYGAAAALVLPSVYEGFGLPLLEAMACGTPVVSSSAASLREIGGSAALYFDPLEVDDIVAQVRRVLIDDTLRAELREAGLERAARFSWRRAARETLAVYNRILAG